MLELLKQAHWSDITTVLAQGNPPLALQLLVVNCIFFFMFAFRRLRGKKTRQNNAAYLINGILILVNAAVLTQAQLLPFYQYNIMVFWHKLQQVL